MLDSIFIGMSGLDGFSKGLKVVSNNITNMNTVGFKASIPSFTNAAVTGENTQSFSGGGLNGVVPHINFNSGTAQSSSNALDLAVTGDGFFVQSVDDKLYYTRDGQMQFNESGVLVSKTTGNPVLGVDADGNVGKITLDSHQSSPPKATQTVSFSGNLSSTDTVDYVVSNVKVIDPSGATQLIKLTFKNTNSTKTGSWTVTATDKSGNTLGSGTLQFNSGVIDPSAEKISLNMTGTDGKAFTVSLDFSQNVTSFASSSTSTTTSGSTVAFASQDGYAMGSLSDVSVDATGTLQFKYDNGQTLKGGTLVLARFDNLEDLQDAGTGLYSVNSTATNVHYLRPGQSSTGTINAKHVEMSNVDISQEFSNLVIVQRGYQASSRIISTANQLIQELFDMKGNR